MYGRVSAITQPETGENERGKWTKQTIVLESFEMPKYEIAFEAMNDRTNQIAMMKVGQAACAKGSVTSREYEGKWYTRVNLWEVKPI